MTEDQEEYVPLEHLYKDEFKEFKNRYSQILKLEEDKYADAYTRLVEDIYSFSTLIGEEFNTVMYHLTK
jgi:hypothetical protein